MGPPAAAGGDVLRGADRVGLAEEAGRLGAVGQGDPAERQRCGDPGQQAADRGGRQLPELEVDRGAVVVPDQTGYAGRQPVEPVTGSSRGRPEQRYGVYEQILLARARLGDLSAASELSTIASSLWGHRSRIGREALDLLVERHGCGAVEAQLSVERPQDRAFVNRMRARDRADLTSALADGDIGVAHEAVELMLGLGVPDDDHLLDHVVTGPTIEARLWAAYVLHRRGRDIRELWAALDRPRIDVPGLAEDVRRAIVRTYPGEAYCDPHWLVEQACADLGPQLDVEAQLGRAIAALAKAGLAPGKPQTGAEAEGTGSSSYHQVETTRGVVLISTLGPFVIGGYQATMPPDALATLEEAGFRWIDYEAASVIVTGMPVYYFGHRDPLDVRTLLFYWQD